MEAFPIEFCRALKPHWDRRSYNGMDNNSGTAYRKKTKRPVVRLGGKRWFARLRSGCKIRTRLPSPVRLLARLRDAYVDAMLGLAGCNGIRVSGRPGPEVLLTRRIPDARAAHARGKNLERKFMRSKKEI